MTTKDADDLVPFLNVRIIRATAAALFCRIGARSVWLPRAHVRGRLWSAGDRGRLFIRRWVAWDRKLIDLRGAAIPRLVLAVSRPRVPLRLRLVRGDGGGPGVG